LRLEAPEIIGAREAMADDRTDYRDGYLVVRDGLRLHYRDYSGSSERPPLVCLHGLTRNARDFADFAKRLSPRFRVIALDFAGRGDSDFDPLPARYNPLVYAGDVLGLLNELGIERAIFVGTSLGGLVTMLLATTAPERIAGAVLIDVGPELEAAGLERIKSYVGKDLRFADWDEAAETIAANNQHLPVNYAHADWVKAAKRACREENGRVRYDYDMAIADVFSAANSRVQVDLWPMFAALAQKPLLIVRGEKSDLLAPDAFERMEATAPTVRSVVVAGAGHAPTLTEPDATVAIDQFLGRF
jgi:pimeloyl-ACP methyl ester carboxylesterase